MKLYVGYTQEQIEWIRKHALDDKYKAWVEGKRYDFKAKRKKKKKKPATNVKPKSKPIPNKPKKKKERIPYHLQLQDKRWLKGERKYLLSKVRFVVGVVQLLICIFTILGIFMVRWLGNTKTRIWLFYATIAIRLLTV